MRLLTLVISTHSKPPIRKINSQVLSTPGISAKCIWKARFWVGPQNTNLKHWKILKPENLCLDSSVRLTLVNPSHPLEKSTHSCLVPLENQRTALGSQAAGPNRAADPWVAPPDCFVSVRAAAGAKVWPCSVLLLNSCESQQKQLPWQVLQLLGSCHSSITLLLLQQLFVN